MSSVIKALMRRESFHSGVVINAHHHLSPETLSHRRHIHGNSQVEIKRSRLKSRVVGVRVSSSCTKSLIHDRELLSSIINSGGRKVGVRIYSDWKWNLSL